MSVVVDAVATVPSASSSPDERTENLLEIIIAIIGLYVDIGSLIYFNERRKVG